MKKIILSLIFVFSSVLLFGQQEIVICESDNSNNTFNYITSAGQPGFYNWTIDGSSVQNGTDSVLTIDWSSYTLGNHIISVGFTNTSGCTAPVVFYSINLLECDLTTMYAPNAFTPNDAGGNNVWIPVGYNYTDLHFMIFNRWGEMIFESYNELFGWDGTYKGDLCKNDVYVYKLDWKDSYGKKNTKYGHIVLLK